MSRLEEYYLNEIRKLVKLCPLVLEQIKKALPCSPFYFEFIFMKGKSKEF